MFHQIEGLWIDHGVKMSDLKGTLAFFAQQIFGPEAKIRLRPSYFQFVEPGAEVDVSCFQCGANPKDSCRICKGTGWLEILGAGMVHPRLLEMAGYGTEHELREKNLTGFAFGMGVERIALLLNHFPDLRMLVQDDVRFLTQFR
jgi:phenylalanyl-tRNA synthetase alpha chain